MKNKNILSLLLCSIIAFSSCNDIFEEDFSKLSMTGLVPANNTQSSSFSQTFRWDEIEGALNYKLQIASPNFASPTTFPLDTTITKNTFSVTLSPGIYQWRVRAAVSESHTEYITYNLMIDSSLDLHNQTVLLSSPADGLYTNTLTTTFSWQAIENAESYLFQVMSANVIVATQSETTTSISYTFSNEGTYGWQVIGQNTLTTSLPSAVRYITVDTTNPLDPVPFYPVNDTTSENPIPLKWNISSTADTLETADYCQLQISTDSTFVIITTKDTVLSVSANPMQYDFYSSLVGQKYYWRVKTLDKAGNTSSYFSARRIERK